MTISTKKKMDRTKTTKTDVRRRAATKSGVRRSTGTPAGRAVHRRAVAAATPAIQITVEREQLAELRDWGIFAGVSLAGWLAAAITFDLI
jgi:hypothetical protein